MHVSSLTPAPCDAPLFTSSATHRDIHLFASPATPRDAYILTSPAAHRDAPFCRRPRDKPATHISSHVPRHTRDTHHPAAHRDTKRNTKRNVCVEFLRTHPAISSVDFANDRHANPTKLQSGWGKDIRLHFVVGCYVCCKRGTGGVCLNGLHCC